MAEVGLKRLRRDLKEDYFLLEPWVEGLEVIRTLGRAIRSYSLLNGVNWD